MTKYGQGHERIAAILYGSETGNALDYAEEVGRLCERLHFQTVVSRLDAHEPVSLAHFSCVVVILSTTGQGDLPVNARSFWKKLLRRKLPNHYLADVKFTTFGLGDSSYPKFNWAARKFHKRLLQLGAYEIYPRGEADEQHEEGLDATWVPWAADLRQQILARYPLDAGVHPIAEDVLLPPKWLLSLKPNHPLQDPPCLCNGDDDSLPPNGLPTTNGYQQAHPMDNATFTSESDPNPTGLLVTLEENRRLTPQNHWQDVRHLRFSCPLSIEYHPGDVLTIFPENSSSDVCQLLELMSWAEYADLPIHFNRTNPVENTDTYSLPPVNVKQHDNPLTLRKLLTYCLDIRAVPRRSFFSAIAHFTDNQTHKERLLEFTNPKYIDELYDYTTRPRRSILEVLQEFHSVKIPWQWAANVLPELRGRQFSIVSGGRRKHASGGRTNFELLVAIVKYKTVIKTLREGVCTRYLSGLPVGTAMEASLQQGSLNIQETDATRPVVMIGPGTGLAPMRSLIWERYDWQSRMSDFGQAEDGAIANGSNQLGETVLFYGCRNREADFFYREEWDVLKENMPLKVFAAFSRDQKTKIYIQDILKQQSEMVYRLLCLQNGLVYVCGSSGKMPQAVRAALVDDFRNGGDMDRDAAEHYLQAMEKEGRYKQETW
ncbi:MAG: hypothetical protein Q9216_005450 [Gyalolechia sp. 2 TL-2023]